jgi:hypothetical protein
VQQDSERPTQVLWVGLPGGTSITDPELYAAFAPCGDLDRVKAFPDRNYAFVQFRSIDGAAHAKSVMQARARRAAAAAMAWCGMAWTAAAPERMLTRTRASVASPSLNVARRAARWARRASR